MSRSLLEVLGSPDAVALIGVLLKASLVLIAAAMLAALLGKASASARHLVWTLALASCAAIVVFAPFAPRFALSIPRPAALIARAESTPMSRRQASVEDATVVTTRADGAGEMLVDRSADARPAASSRLTAISLADTLADTLGVAWLIGLIAVLGWCALGHVALRRVRRSARALVGAEWTSLRERCETRLGIATPVVLLESDAVGTPVTWGFRHPAVVLPAGASGWTMDRKRVVLLHEMAHIARFDYVRQVIATVACSIFWFHPGVWLAARRLRVEAERACDDTVLGAGLSGVDYAAHLLDVARRMRAMRLIGLAAVGMARPSHLEERLLAVLTSIPSRRPVRSHIARVAIVTTMLAIVPVAGIRPHLVAAPPVAPVRAPDVVTRTPTIVVGESPRASRTTVTSVEGSRSQAFDFEDSVSALPEGELHLDLRTGATLDILGWDKPWVRVRGKLGGPDAYRTRVSLASTERGARLRSALDGSDRSSSTSHTFEIRVPKKYDIRVASAGGGVTLSNLDGEFRGSTGGGPLTLEWLTGHASLSTGGGDIHVSSSDLSGRVSTGGGAVVLSGVKGGLRGSSGSGPVVYSRDEDGNAEVLSNLQIQGERISVGASGGGKGTGQGVGRGVGRGGSYADKPGLSISKAGGGIDLAEAPDGATLHTGGGRIRVGRSSGVIDVTTGGGDIELGAVAGSAYASTGAGDVHITVVDADGQEHSVGVTSGKGNVVLELPANLNARFELETAYTDNYRSKTTITSDFTLERDESTEWDDRYGTPRKFVRATGEVGRGSGGLIRVRTVNGNITVRRAR